MKKHDGWAVLLSALLLFVPVFSFIWFCCTGTIFGAGTILVWFMGPAMIGAFEIVGLLLVVGLIVVVAGESLFVARECHNYEVLSAIHAKRENK